ncbi:MAG TPA: hypothetical protein VN381_15250 [Anaerovoracaceae bacterium]|nr:hypothetical protein [Anaerovoracaceae bacterium]
MKEYRYRIGYYLVSVLGPNIMMVCLLVWAVYGRVQGESGLLQQIVLTVVPLLLISSLIAMSQPRLITDDGETLTFYGFFQKHAYKWSEIRNLRIRRFIMSDKVLVRIGKDRLLAGRYWLDTDSLEGCSELLDKMIPYDPQYERYNRGKMKKKAAAAPVKGKK